MKGYVCKICGFISINGSAPDKCPVCGAPKTAFEEKENAIKTAQDQNNLTELEKKHVPVITLVKKCGLIPEGWQDVHVKWARFSTRCSRNITLCISIFTSTKSLLQEYI